jgi:alkylation response protein AidB-like acyl-CoA dehydrogenase
MIPREYGGGGLSNVDLIIAAEEICAVDPGFACTVLVNGLGLLPVRYYGTEEQKDRFLRAATSDPTGEYIVGYAASEPAGSPGGTALPAARRRSSTTSIPATSSAASPPGSRRAGTSAGRPRTTSTSTTSTAS